MKKLFFLILAIVSLQVASFAQTKPAAKPAAPKTEHHKAVKDSAGVVMKKDGTPDKRYKKSAAADTVHVKKDGTPDKRFKENKKKTKA